MAQLLKAAGGTPNEGSNRTASENGERFGFENPKLIPSESPTWWQLENGFFNDLEGHPQGIRESFAKSE